MRQGGARSCRTLNGFKFPADDPDHLTKQLVELQKGPVDRFNAITTAARTTVQETYSSKKILERYRRLFLPVHAQQGGALTWRIVKLMVCTHASEFTTILI
jgi:hypothetical protein